MSIRTAGTPREGLLGFQAIIPKETHTGLEGTHSNDTGTTTRVQFASHQSSLRRVWCMYMRTKAEGAPENLLETL